MIDVPRRLRRAILLNDLSLVTRILRNNPTHLLNPDFADKSNTSLHLAATHGHAAIVSHLISLSHDCDLISLNNDASTPLMLACAASREETAVLLARHFPHCIPYRNNRGVDALMLAAASGSGTLHLIPTLITLCPGVLTAVDNNGDTALHYASAAGELKALRMLLAYGAEPLALNWASWTPVHYSASIAAEAYFRGLVFEREKSKAEGKRVAAASAAAVEEKEREMEREREREGQRSRVGRAKGLVRLVTETEEGEGEVLEPPAVEWSPVDERRRAMTPTELRGLGTFDMEGIRPRAGTGGSV